MPSALPQADLQKRLYAAVLSDVLDGMGLREQAMKPFIRPLDEASVLFGRARTGLSMPVYEVWEGENPYEVGKSPRSLTSGRPNVSREKPSFHSINLTCIGWGDSIVDSCREHCKVAPSLLAMVRPVGHAR